MNKSKKVYFKDVPSFVAKVINHKKNSTDILMLKEFLNCNKDDIREDYLKCYSPYLIYKKRD